MKALNSISSFLNKLLRLILIICFSVMTVSYFSQIVLRYVFGTGLHWTEELTRYTNIALVMFGSAVISGRKNHINISVLETIIPQKYVKWAYLLQQVLTIVFFGTAIFYGFDMMKLAGTQVSTNLRIPMKIIYGIFPTAFSILVFQTFVYILNDVFELGKKEGAL